MRTPLIGKIEDLLTLPLIAEPESGILEGIGGGHLRLLLFERSNLQMEYLLLVAQPFQFLLEGPGMKKPLLAKQTQKKKI